jgi:Na+/glutamate symporter
MIELNPVRYIYMHFMFIFYKVKKMGKRYIKNRLKFYLMGNRGLENE